MKLKRKTSVVLLIAAASFTSCLSGYRAVNPRDHQHGHTERKSPDGNPFRAIILEAPMKGDTGSFYITLVAPHTTNAAPLRLSNLRITPIAVSESSPRYSLQRIEFSLTPPSGYRTHLKTIAGPQIAESADFDLTTGEYYNITYIFSNNPRRRLKQITANIDADLSGAIEQKGYHCTVAFRRYSSLQIYH